MLQLLIMSHFRRENLFQALSNLETFDAWLFQIVLTIRNMVLRFKATVCRGCNNSIRSYCLFMLKVELIHFFTRNVDKKSSKTTENPDSFFTGQFLINSRKTTLLFMI
jgi:hypothetical protein